MSFGLNYMGSKNRIAPELIRKLPVGKRLIDLFGGGFAVAHCAALAGKWRTVLYNDVNPLVVQLVKDALAGKYDEGVFKPEFISRERFFAEKDTCGYVKWGWSFGGNGERIQLAMKRKTKRRNWLPVVLCAIAGVGLLTIEMLASRHMLQRRLDQKYQEKVRYLQEHPPTTTHIEILVPDAASSMTPKRLDEALHPAGRTQ